MVTQQHRVAGRLRLLAGVVVAVTIGTATSCAPTPASEWLSPGCYINASTTVSAADMRYSGKPNLAGNTELAGEWVGDVWNASSGGTCAGPDVIAATLVRASDLEGATRICAELGYANAEPPIRLIDIGYSFPADARGCVNDPT